MIARVLDAALLVAALGLVLWLPGAAALGLARHRSSDLTRLAHALGTSLALWPLALLWSTLAGVSWSAAGVRIALTGLAGAMAVRAVRSPARPRRPDAARLAAVAIIAIAVVLRAHHVHGVAVPLWVDGYHHTLVTELIRAGGTVPTGLRPYVPVDAFYYHFGFHAVAATVAWARGATSPAAVLWLGQALNAAAALAAWALARRMTRRPVSAVLAAAVPASLYWFPSYYVTWGRYTQLAGLVALPTAWLLLLDAMRAPRHPRRAVVLAGLVSAGLLLLHYRVFVYYLLGAAIIAASRACERRRRVAALTRFATVGAVGLGAAAPWLFGALWSGASDLRAAGATWFGGPSAVADVPDWLFTTGWNAPVLALSAIGILLALTRRRPAALALSLWCALALAVAFPAVIGLATSWTLPPFALAISLWLPAAVAIAFLADSGIDLARRRWRSRRVEHAALALALALTLLGARRTWSVVNPETVIATAEDVAAARWIRSNTPAGARFLVSTAHWHLGTYRGLDGGYWLPLLAGRDASIPASFYAYGDPGYAAGVTRTAEIAARGDALSDRELAELMDRAGTDHVYVGPAAANVAGKLSSARLARVPWLSEVWSSGGVHVYRRTSAR